MLQYRSTVNPAMSISGLRPPILGTGRHRNLWFNTGHGHMGWTMACGSARIVADLIDGRAPEIDIAGLTVERY